MWGAVFSTRALTALATRRGALGRQAAAASSACVSLGGQRGLSSMDSSKAAEQAKKWQQQKPEDKAKFLSVQVDRSALRNPSDSPLHSKAPVDLPEGKSKENTLVHILRTMIEVKGPLTVAEFMQRALSHPDHGYYMKKDVFGSQGDFTTAPEISQMFGELIAIWCVATWQQMGMPEAIKVVELGPGRGSLMSDFLRAAKSFPPFYQALELHMVDMSPAMHKIQQETLQCEPVDDKKAPEGTMRLPDGGPTVRWHADLTNVPHGLSLMIAQELFDALPVHQFEYTERGWCERLVDIDFEDGGDHFRFVLSPGPTPATRVYIGREKIFDPSTTLPAASPSVITGVNDLERMTQDPGNEANRVIQRLDVADVAGTPVLTKEAQVGDRIEISPVGIALAQDMAKRISQSGGAALMVDYGHDHPSPLSLRGIKDHEFVSVLREPGDVDLSIDVDFATLRRYATLEPKVLATGPVGQGAFLKNMGIQQRLAILLQNTESEELQQEMFSAYERLVEPNQMGTIFKAMAFTHEDIGEPVGFEQHPEEPSKE